MKALYAGSFDPFTIGHLFIVRSALAIFDELVIGIGYNESKKGEWEVDVRENVISEFFRNEPRVKVVAYSGLTAEFAKKEGLSVLVRGIRNSMDYEKEKELADVNREVFGISTVFIPSESSVSFISSSMIRELMHNGYNVSKYLAGDFPVPPRK